MKILNPFNRPGLGTTSDHSFLIITRDYIFKCYGNICQNIPFPEGPSILIAQVGFSFELFQIFRFLRQAIVF